MIGAEDIDKSGSSDSRSRTSIYVVSLVNSHQDGARIADPAAEVDKIQRRGKI